MKISLDRKGTYVPEWNGNRELPKDDQIVIEFERVVPEIGTRMISLTTDGKIVTDFNLVILNCVIQIKNLTFNGTDIKSAASLLKVPSVTPLVREIAQHILSESVIEPEVEKKNEDSDTLDQSIS